MNHYVIIILSLATIILLSLGYADTAISWGALCLLILVNISNDSGNIFRYVGLRVYQR